MGSPGSVAACSRAIGIGGFAGPPAGADSADLGAVANIGLTAATEGGVASPGVITATGNATKLFLRLDSLGSREHLCSRAGNIVSAQGGHLRPRPFVHTRRKGLNGGVGTLRKLRPLFMLRL